jgi:hypothetical protein
MRCGAYREDVLQSNGTFMRVQRRVVLGPVSSLSERAAWKLFQPYLDRVNAAGKLPLKSGMTLEQFVKECRLHLSPSSSDVCYETGTRFELPYLARTLDGHLPDTFFLTPAKQFSNGLP